jgi:hypothetical protein
VFEIWYYEYKLTRRAKENLVCFGVGNIVLLKYEQERAVVIVLLLTYKVQQLAV